jgi:hypothetical protein
MAFLPSVPAPRSVITTPPASRTLRTPSWPPARTIIIGKHCVAKIITWVLKLWSKIIQYRV